MDGFWQYEIIEGAKNFYSQFNPLAVHTETYYMELQGLSENIEVDVEKLRGLSKEKILRMTFSRVYNFVIDRNEDFSIFSKDMHIYDDMLDACYFTELCMFLYDTRRIKGMSLREFAYKYSPQKYNIKGSPNYFDYDYTKRNSEKGQGVVSEDTKLRKYRHRFLSQRPVYADSSEGSAMRKVSEYEWTLYYELDGENVDAEIRNTFKRIKNLYNEINTVLNSLADRNNQDKIEAAHKKFLSKLKKLKYENFLELSKFFISHINKNKNYYGINLYKFERELKVYKITEMVRRCLECKSTKEMNELLEKDLITGDIVFPKLYNYFGSSETLRAIHTYRDIFNIVVKELIISSHLVIDKIVEMRLLGENWDILFLDIINKLAESVLYNPGQIDYTVAPGAQEKFMKILEYSAWQ